MSQVKYNVLRKMDKKSMNIVRSVFEYYKIPYEKVNIRSI